MLQDTEVPKKKSKLSRNESLSAGGKAAVKEEKRLLIPRPCFEETNCRHFSEDEALQAPQLIGSYGHVNYIVEEQSGQLNQHSMLIGKKIG